MVNCSLGDDRVHSYKDTCNFTCDTGYMLNGSYMRTCQSNGIWSGTDVMCIRSKWSVYICNYVTIKFTFAEGFYTTQSSVSFHLLWMILTVCFMHTCKVVVIKLM